MLLGRQPNNPLLDGKWRFTVPRCIREEVADEGEAASFHLGVLLDKCVYLHTEEQQEVFLSAFDEATDDTEKNRALKTMVHAAFVPVTTDKAGRVIIPADLRKKAGIIKEIVVVGMKDRTELWGVEVYDQLHEVNEEVFRVGLEEALQRVGEARRSRRARDD
ncbi:MAG: hypothetical protein V3W41_01200 [Planctomycetota bacterium]